MIFLCILASSWKAFGLIFTSILRSKFHQKMHSKFHRFLDRFWEAFGLPWPPIWLPKSLQKSIQAALGAQRGPWSVPGSLRTLKSHQKWSPKWAQDPQNRPFGRVQASKTEPQSSQHGIPKHQISQNGLWPREPQMIPKQIKHRAKQTQTLKPN